MTIKPGKRSLGRPDRQVLLYAAMFMLCAMISALGAGVLALLLFPPAAAGVAWLRRSEQGRAVHPVRQQI